MSLFKRDKGPTEGEDAAALGPVTPASQPTAADGLIQDPLAGGAGAMAGFGGMGGLAGVGGLGGLFEQIRQAQQAAATFQMGAGGMPMVDTRNDPELRAKLEQALGHPLESGQMETLDFSSDPQKAMAVMQVIQQHQLEKMGMGGAAAAGGVAAAGPPLPAAGNDAAAAGVMGIAAAATIGATAPAAQPSASDDELSKLERLAKLHESGALTDEEFATEKKRLLGET